jgi:hypothetical protein
MNMKLTWLLLFACVPLYAGNYLTTAQTKQEHTEPTTKETEPADSFYLVPKPVFDTIPEGSAVPGTQEDLTYSIAPVLIATLHTPPCSAKQKETLDQETDAILAQLGVPQVSKTPEEASALLVAVTQEIAHANQTISDLLNPTLSEKNAVSEQKKWEDLPAQEQLRIKHEKAQRRKVKRQCTAH